MEGHKKRNFCTKKIHTQLETEKQWTKFGGRRVVRGSFSQNVPKLVQIYIFEGHGLLSDDTEQKSKCSLPSRSWYRVRRRGRSSPQSTDLSAEDVISTAPWLISRSSDRVGFESRESWNRELVCVSICTRTQANRLYLWKQIQTRPNGIKVRSTNGPNDSFFQVKVSWSQKVELT